MPYEGDSQMAKNPEQVTPRPEVINSNHFDARREELSAEVTAEEPGPARHCGPNTVEGGPARRCAPHGQRLSAAGSSVR